MELLHHLQRLQQRTLKPLNLPNLFTLLRTKTVLLTKQVMSFGFSEELDDYEKRKLGIFNLLNFFQLITGVVIPALGAFFVTGLPAGAWIIAAVPAVVSVTVLFMNSQKQHKSALIFYFISYPVFTCFIYINGFNPGIELTFVLYGILSVFFLQEIGYMVFSIALSMISYFILSVVLKDYQYQLKSLNLVAYLINQALAIAYIFYGLYLIKRENTGHQESIMKQQSELRQQAELMREQAVELAEANTLNNKLFSVISHDLKTPMYALRNFFHNAHELKLPAREIRNMLPDVIHDLNYTTGLMDNLLHWAKSQMQSHGARPQELDMNSLVEDVIQLLRIQADAKKILIERKISLPVYAFGDRDMINLVVRNLLSNAIKFTPPGGRIAIGTSEHDSFSEVYIKDSGRGISREEMRKINEDNFYSTKGTASEAGTGLGLMLCKEFLEKNHGRLMIESEPGQGSTFSFTLPHAYPDAE
jgi:two-component system, sensor histidine kinase and response regulator